MYQPTPSTTGRGGTAVRLTLAVAFALTLSVAGPPSPVEAAVALPIGLLPATVVIIPSGLTLRIRWLPESTMKRLPAVSTASRS